MTTQNLQNIQLFLIRIYLGLNIIPDFWVKLFAGSIRRQSEITIFTKLGVIYPAWMVMVAGLIELAIFISFVFGFMTRVAAVCTAIFFLVIIYLADFYQHGFLFAAPGGGWSYAALCGFMYFTFVFTGGGPWSLDALLRKSFSTFIFK